MELNCSVLMCDAFVEIGQNDMYAGLSIDVIVICLVIRTEFLFIYLVLKIICLRFTCFMLVLILII